VEAADRLLGLIKRTFMSKEIKRSNSRKHLIDKSVSDHRVVELCAELYIGRHVQELERVPEALEFYRNYVSMNLPVVIRGAVSHWPAVRLWTNDYLRSSHV